MHQSSVGVDDNSRPGLNDLEVVGHRAQGAGEGIGGQVLSDCFGQVVNGHSEVVIRVQPVVTAPPINVAASPRHGPPKEGAYPVVVRQPIPGQLGVVYGEGGGPDSADYLRASPAISCK